MYSPEIYPENVKHIYPLAKKLDMPMTTLVNLILAIAVEELEQVENLDEMLCYEPSRPEERNERQSIHVVR